MERTIRTLFEGAVKSAPSSVFLEYLVEGERKQLSYSDTYDTVCELAELFAVAGIDPKARPVALILENCHEWIETYLALSGTAIPIVPIDPKLRASEVAYILKDSNACAVVTDSGHLQLLESVLEDLPHIQTIFLHHVDENEAPKEIVSREVISIQSRLKVDSKRALSPEGRYASVTPVGEDICAIIYTSGTTGQPKGALLTNDNFFSDIDGTMAAIPFFKKSDRFLVVLPLFHAFSFTANFLVCLYNHARLQFVRSLRTVGEDMKIFHPTALMAVPLLVEKFAGKIDTALRTNRALLLLQAFHLRGLVKHLILRSLGGKLRIVITGGAPCSTDVIAIMRRFGIPVVEGYGLTEASPIVSICAPKRAKIGTIGPALPNIEAKIEAPDEHGIGELILKGPIVMKGYLGRPDDTSETLQDGWLHTGDLATIDGDGYITIRGRKKSLIVNREGKNIYPEEVELCLARDKRLIDILVMGYKDRQEIGEKVGVIIVPDVKAFVNEKGEQMSESEISQEVRAIVRTLCGDLATYKHPRLVDVRFEPLKRTPALKIRRKVYEGQLDRL